MYLFSFIIAWLVLVGLDSLLFSFFVSVARVLHLTLARVTVTTASANNYVKK